MLGMRAGYSLCTDTMSDTYHVIPLNDRKVHVDSETCHCKPRKQQEPNGVIVIHNSYDGREFYEDAEAFNELSLRI